MTNDHPAILSAAERRELGRKLLKWYDRHHRDLPWRRRPADVYRQWIAETMLQQTQVATVTPYFTAFTRRFPTLQRLAEASLDDVLAAWSGLGYYARARNLHRTARIVAGELGGEFPTTLKDLQDLPGVGRYTAGALASIALGQRAAVLDGNVKRVLARLLRVMDDIRAARTSEALWTAAYELLPTRRCGDFNQALMELGATVCIPRNPPCSTCPILTHCRAYAAGLVDTLPVVKPRRAPAAIQLAVLGLRARNRCLIRQRSTGSLWGGLWEPPTLQFNGQRSARAALATLLPQFWPDRRVDLPIPERPSAELTRRLTHRTVRFQIFLCRGKPGLAAWPLPPHCLWATATELRRLGLSAAHRKVLAIMFPEMDLN